MDGRLRGKGQGWTAFFLRLRLAGGCLARSAWMRASKARAEFSPLIRSGFCSRQLAVRWLRRMDHTEARRHGERPIFNSVSPCLRVRNGWPIEGEGSGMDGLFSAAAFGWRVFGALCLDAGQQGQGGVFAADQVRVLLAPVGGEVVEKNGSHGGTEKGRSSTPCLRVSVAPCEKWMTGCGGRVRDGRPFCGGCVWLAGVWRALPGCGSAGPGPSSRR